MQLRQPMIGGLSQNNTLVFEVSQQAIGFSMTVNLCDLAVDVYTHDYVFIKFYLLLKNLSLPRQKHT